MLRLYLHHQKQRKHNLWDFGEKSPALPIGKELRNKRNSIIWRKIEHQFVIKISEQKQEVHFSSV